MEKYLQSYLKERNIPINSLEANSIQEGYQLAVKRVREWLIDEFQQMQDIDGHPNVESRSCVSVDELIQDFLRKVMNYEI